MGDTPSRPAQEAGNEATRLQAAARGSGELASSSAAVANANNEAPRPGDGDRGAQEDVHGAPEAKREMSDCDILAALLGYLGKQAGNSLAVSSIFTSRDIPEELRELAADRESVLRWLGKFQGLLGVEGPEGHEEIVLLLGRSRPGVNGEAAIGPASGVPSPTSQVVGPPSPPPSSGTGAAASAVADDKRTSAKGSANTAGGAAAAAEKEDDAANHATVQLRGLPFKATIADIKEFLGVHAQKLANSENSIRLLMNRDQRPSGFARVQFASAEAAAAAREALHKKPMGERYIEVLPCADRDRKARRGLRPAGEGDPSAHGDTEAGAGAAGQLNEAEEQERVLQECRQHMLEANGTPILLSSLGIALTQPARDYVHRLNLGLKHFLVKFNDEFRVEGAKGVEKVVWRPDRRDPQQQLPVDFGGGCLGVKAADGLAGQAVSEPAKEPLTPQTRIIEPPRAGGTGGTSGPSGSHRSGGPGLSTPSLWGTPGMHAASMEEGAWNGHWSQQNGWLGDSGPVMEGLEGTMPWSNGFWPPQPGSAWPSEIGGTEGKASAARRSHAHLHPKSHPFARGRIPGTSSTESAEFEGPAANLPAVRLRGLPFDLSGQDVLAFFAHHDVAGGIADGPNVVHMLPKANGRPSGQAVVQMRSLQHAEAAYQALNTKKLGSRYIEVFVYGASPTEVDGDAMAPPGLPEFHQGALGDFAGVAPWPWPQPMPPFGGSVLGPMGLGGGMVGPLGYPGLPGGLIDPAFDPAHTDIFEPCAGTAASQGGDMGASAGCTVGAAVGEGGGGNSSSVPAGGPSPVTIQAV